MLFCINFLKTGWNVMRIKKRCDFSFSCRDSKPQKCTQRTPGQRYHSVLLVWFSMFGSINSVA